MKATIIVILMCLGAALPLMSFKYGIEFSIYGAFCNTVWLSIVALSQRIEIMRLRGEL